MADSDSISIMIGGDFCPAGSVETRLRGGSLTAEALLEPLARLFERGDIRAVNLECPLTECSERIEKPSAHVRAHPDMIELLRFLKVDVVTLANNHVRDYGCRGVLDTLETCERSGIATVGAGATLGAARKPLMVTAKGRRVAFVNAAEQEFSNATTARAGANPLDLINLLRDLCEARKRAEHVVLILHGGLEMTNYPSPESVRLMRFLAEQEVTAVVRHHAHVVQGYEIWKGVPIFYGLGNMLFDAQTRMAPGWYQGLVVELAISPDNACRARLHPVSQGERSSALTVLEGDARERALRRMETYSLALADERMLAQEWAGALRTMKADYFSKLLIPSPLLRRAIRRLGLMGRVYPKGWSAQYWENVLRCDTHREALLDMLIGDHES